MQPTQLLKLLIVCLALWFIGHIIYISFDGLKENNRSADVAVILGSKVNVDGTLSERLQKRLECGLALYRKGQVKKLLVSGGLGKEGHYKGTKMKEFLASNGVPDSLIMVDDKGDNTEATVNNTINLKNSLQFTSVIVVSQYFHITRTKMLFRKKHFNNVTGASPRYFEIRDFYSLTREFFAYYLG